MTHDDIIDYAMPLIKIERMTKEIHDLCLAHKYEAAHEAAMHLGAEVRVLQHTLVLMDEKEKERAHAATQINDDRAQEIPHKSAKVFAYKGHDGRGSVSGAAH